MFQLCKNNFLSNGVCHYKDNYGNKAFIKRIGDMVFVAKLRFADERVKTAPMNIDVQKAIDGEVFGCTLHIDYAADTNIDVESVNSGVSSFMELIQYWVSLYSDLRFSWGDSRIQLEQMKSAESHVYSTWDGRIVGNVDHATELDIYKYKYDLLKKYSELEPVLGQLSPVS